MKIQCSCGAKYNFEIAPGMQPVHFVCQSCGQDYSAFINDLISKELGQVAPPPAAPLRVAIPHAAPEAPPPSPAPPPQPTSATAPAAPKLRINRGHAPEAPAQAQPPAAVSKYCERHRTELATDHCQVCQKPICPKCLETLGPFCSPFCKNKVEGPSMNAPAMMGSKFLAQRQFWRKTGLISSVAGVVLAVALGFWFWYAWIGSRPVVGLTVNWDDISHSGTSRIVGGNQLVFLHGGTLARYNLDTKQKVWSLDLISAPEVAAALQRETEERNREVRENGSYEGGRVMVPHLQEKYARIGLEQQLSLHGIGQTIWIARGNTLTHYDWDSGNVIQTVTLTNNFGGLTDHGNEFLAVGTADDGAQTVTHVNMDDGAMRTEEFYGSSAVAQNAPPAMAPAQGGLPLSPDGGGRPLNARRTEQQAQNMTYVGRIALPALLANNEHNQQISQEMHDEDRDQDRQQRRQAPARQPAAVNFHNFTLIPDGDSYIAFASQMIQQNVVQHEAMKAPPQHSALDSVNSANESAAVNEQLNDIQRNNGGDKVTEDQSVYQVALRRPTSTQPDWIGEVKGPPQFFPLKTVNVLAAGKTIIVFDKTNKKLWQDNLTYNVTGGDGQEVQSEYGAGPCVENNGTLYVFDQAVLTAYDPTSGNARWRIPSVGVVGLFFDDKGMVYVNTTTGNPDDIKYSRQIDVDKQTSAVVLKVDPANGTILWTAKPGGYVAYLSGKFMYASQYFDPGDKEDEMSDAMDGLESPPYLRIIRIAPASGHILWEYNEDNAPVDMQFDKNIISLILKKHVEVLRFFTL